MRLLALIDPGTRPELTVYRLLVSELPVEDKAVVVVLDVAFYRAATDPLLNGLLLFDCEEEF